MERRARVAVAMGLVVTLAAAIGARAVLLAPEPIVLTLVGLFIALTAAAVFVDWWTLQAAAMLAFAFAYAIALSLGPDRLDLAAPLVAVGVGLIYEAIDLVHALRSGTQLGRQPALERGASALFVVAAGVSGGFAVILAGSAITATSGVLLLIAAVAGLGALAYLVVHTRRATSG